MLSAISKALDTVCFTIPRQVLDAVFLPSRQGWRATQPINVRDQILLNVIKARVMVDMNLVGGTIIDVPLDEATKEMFDANTTIYYIPKSLTQNRSIISADRIDLRSNIFYSGADNLAMNNRSRLLELGRAVMDAQASMPMVSNARIALINDNVVMVRDLSRVPPNAYLRCLVANDDTLSNLQLRTYPKFTQLAIYAVKSYIYNEYTIWMDRGELYAGQELGSFKTTIEKYEDAEQNYQDYLRDVWTKVAFMNDDRQKEQMIRLMIGGVR